MASNHSRKLGFKSYISMSKAQRLINSHSCIHSRKYLSRPLDLIGNWQNDILARETM
nr:MAG TPA: hypothetical protein [Caudoviricetes sp.]